jgi:hypothetical protein
MPPLLLLSLLLPDAKSLDDDDIDGELPLSPALRAL